LRPRWITAYLAFLFMLAVDALALACLGGEPMRPAWPPIAVLGFFTLPVLSPLVALVYTLVGQDRPPSTRVQARLLGFSLGAMPPLFVFIAADLARRTCDYDSVAPLIGLLWIVHGPALPIMVLFPVHDPHSAKILTILILVVSCSVWGGLGYLVGRWSEGPDEP